MIIVKKLFRNEKITSKLNIPFIDLSKLLFSEKEDPREFYSFGGHFNEKGYKKVA